MDRRIEGLLAAALRSKQLARGANAVVGACQRGEAELVLVATDAAAAADLGEVRRAVAAGRAVAWGTKERLGRLVAPRPVRTTLAPASPEAPDGVGVLAITSRPLAEELSRTVRMAAQLDTGAKATPVAKPASPEKPAAPRDPVTGAAARPRSAGATPRKGGARGATRAVKDYRSDR
jgi:ribosomal protein L7Ae-like RNA K-turn-binding protein